MARPAIKPYSVPTGSDDVICVDAQMEGVQGSGRVGVDSCSTMSEPPCDVVAASLSRCRRRRNFWATFSGLQVATDELTGLDDISGGGRDRW